MYNIEEEILSSSSLQNQVDESQKKVPRKWSEEELYVLKKFYPQKGGKYVAKRLSRTHTSVIGQAVRLGIHRANLRKWHEWEIRYIRKYYGQKTASSIARTLGRSLDAVQIKAGKLNLTKIPVQRYTDEEKAYIRESYESGTATIAEMAQHLNKPVTAIQSRISRWKLKSAITWKKEESNFLKRNYHKMTSEEIGKAIGRSARAVLHYAHRHGLKKAQKNISTDKSNQITV